MNAFWVCVPAPSGPPFEWQPKHAERVGAAGRTQVDATQARRVADCRTVGSAGAPAVLGAELVAEQLVADDEERVDAKHLAIEGRFGERGVLDQLAGIARVEHAVEVLAAAQVHGAFELLEEGDVVGDDEVGGIEGGPARVVVAVRRLRPERSRGDPPGDDEDQEHGAPGPWCPPPRDEVGRSGRMPRWPSRASHVPKRYAERLRRATDGP